MPNDPESIPTPAAFRARREALGQSPEQAARRTGLTTVALLRFEAGDGGLTAEQVAAVIRALGDTGTTDAPHVRRPLLDFGLFGTVVFLLGAAIPTVMAAVSAFDALRFIGSEHAVAEVVGFERRVRIAEPRTGPRYEFETVAPLLRFHQPDGGGEVTIAWHVDRLPHEADFALGDRVPLVFPRGAPELAALSIRDVVLKPLVGAVFAAPLLGIGLVSLRHLRRRRHAGA